MIKSLIMLYIFILSVLIFLTPLTWLVVSVQPKKKTAVNYSPEVNRLLERD